MNRREPLPIVGRSQEIVAVRSRRRAEIGQSAIIAVIVLFLLLFLGAAFIALIANNLRNTKNAAITSASGRYAEAGIRYLDEQLTTSPEGADWRPLPECPTSVDGTCSVNPKLPYNATSNPLKIDNNDPDYFWLQPFKFDVARQEYVGGYTRVNFGGPTPSAAGAGGRALVRLTYRPDIYTTGGQLQTNASGAYPDPHYTPDSTHKFIKLEVVGRSGQIDPLDPTTFGNTNALGQRVELSAYKQIGINEYARQVYNKENKPDSFPIGAPAPVQDYTVSGGTVTPVTRNIETIIDGPVRFNSNLTFYGVNRILLNPQRGDALLVAGQINLNGIAPQTTTATATTDPTQVYLYTPTGAAGTVQPSMSPIFSTDGGLARDNPQGSNTLEIPYPVNGTNTDQANSNLRGVARIQPPAIDQVVGPNGLTRYLEVTRDSPPLPSTQTGITTLPTSAGTFGWGTGMYINNNADVQNSGPFSSPRAEWLNPTSYGGNRPWQSDSAYEPYAVDINLTPGYMTLTDKGQNTTQGSYFQAPSNTITVKNSTGNTTFATTTGANLAQSSVVRYSTPLTAGNLQNETGISDGTPIIQGYPATPLLDTNGNAVTGVYVCNYVIYAEGNVRIHGVVGGTYTVSGGGGNATTFIRHLTVVSNGTIYVDGNLLRDNLPSGNPYHGTSSIALLAKNYIAVNTTQFLSPSLNTWQSEQISGQPPFSRQLNQNPGYDHTNYQLTFGPMDNANTPLTYPAPAASSGSTTQPIPAIFLRDAADLGGAAGGGGQTTASGAAVRLAVNPLPTAQILYYQFNQPANPDPATLLLPSTPIQTGTTGTSVPGYNDQVYALSAGTTAINNAIGLTNYLQMQYDTAESQAQFLLTRFGVAPLDIRIEAMMYAQEGSFFIIPGPWFNPTADDTQTNYLNTSDPTRLYRRAGESTAPDGSVLTSVSPYFPFYGQPMDIRITFFGAISENEPAEIGDQGAWMEKWGWVPNYWGSSALPTAGQVNQTQTVASIASLHGPYGALRYPLNESGQVETAVPGSGQPAGGSGIVYQFDDHALSPYYDAGGGVYQPIRPDMTKSYKDGGNNTIYMPLPLTPNLPVAPGLLYFGEDTNVPQ